MDKLEKVVSRIQKLPSVPANIKRINDMIDKHHITLDAIGREIAKDQTLSAQVLKLINSGFYGFSGNISSIPHAVVLLGINTVRNIVTSAWLSEMIDSSTKGMHDHSTACARACFLIAKNLGHNEPEDMGTIGLLHDIGKVVLAQHLSDDFETIKNIVVEKRMTFRDAEYTHLEVDHADVARWLLTKWNLPAPTVSAIAMHHNFDPEAETAQQTAVLILADAIVHAEGYTCGCDNRMPDLKPEVMELLEVDVADLRLLMDEWIDQMYDLERYDGE